MNTQSKTIWERASEWKGVIAVIVAFATLILTFGPLPAQVDENTNFIEALQDRQAVIETKLDIIICLETYEDEADRIRCELLD